MSGYLRLRDYIRVRSKMTRDGVEIHPHTDQVCDALELCFAEALPNNARHLLIVLPPRFGKTSLLRGFVEWAQGHLPDCEWIYSSYAKELAAKQVSMTRDIILSPWYREMFPRCQIKAPRGSEGRQDLFYTEGGGCIYAAGAKGSIIGFGAGKRRTGFGGAFIVDDPVKATEAKSETGRKNAVDFMDSVAETRLNSSRTPIIMIMQRLHPDDPAAHLLKTYGNQVHVVHVPALQPDDTATYPGAKSAEELIQMREVRPDLFYTQYQGEPTTPGGNIIKKDWWHYYNDKAEILKRCRGYFITADTAMKAKQQNDESVLQLWGYEGAERLYLIDQLSGRWEFPELLEAAKAFWDHHRDIRTATGPSVMFVEDKVSGTSLIQSLQRKKINVMEWNARDFEIEGEDKVSRVHACTWSIWGGRVWLPDPDLAPWVNGFVEQCAAFASDMSHSHDDQVDAMTMAVLTWHSQGGGMKG